MEGKVAIVTGGGGGIGGGIVRALHAKGVKVVATGRSEGKLVRLGEELGSAAYASIAVDITAAHAPKAIVDHAMDTFGRLDIVVNNAGSFNFGSVHSTTDEMLDEVLAISLRAPFRLCREALPHLGQGSSILFVG